MYLSDAFQAKAQRHTDHPSVHGMALIGDQTLFLSHLPLFSSPGRRSRIIIKRCSKPLLQDARHQT